MKVDKFSPFTASQFQNSRIFQYTNLDWSEKNILCVFISKIQCHFLEDFGQGRFDHLVGGTDDFMDFLCKNKIISVNFRFAISIQLKHNE